VQAQTRPHFGRNLTRLLLRVLAEGEAQEGKDEDAEDGLALSAPVKFAMASALLEHIRTHWHEPEAGGVIGSDDRRVIRECLLDAILSQPSPGADARVVHALRMSVQRAWESDCHIVPPCKTFLDRVVGIISSASDRYQPAATASADAAAAPTVDAGHPAKEEKGKEKALDVEQQQLHNDSGEENDDHPLEQALIILYHLNKHFQYRYVVDAAASAHAAAMLVHSSHPRTDLDLNLVLFSTSTAFHAVKLEIVEHVMPILLRLFAGLMEDRTRLERHTVHLQYLLKSYWALSRMVHRFLPHICAALQRCGVYSLTSGPHTHTHTHALLLVYKRRAER
jgi:hypothetical protein